MLNLLDAPGFLMARLTKPMKENRKRKENQLKDTNGKIMNGNQEKVVEENSKKENYLLICPG